MDHEYEVHYEVTVPDFGIINLTAGDEVLAKEIGEEMIEDMYPEALDIDVVEVKKVH